MKFTELRLGNLVRFNNLIEAERVVEVNFWFFRVSYRENDSLEINDFYKPIDLTDEWLIKFGFKPFCKDWQRNGIILHTRKRGFVVRKSVPIMKYVHQLQNYYYANKGEELTLTPNH